MGAISPVSLHSRRRCEGHVEVLHVVMIGIWKAIKIISKTHHSWQWRHMSVMASQIASTVTVCSQVCSGLLHRKHQTDVADVSLLWRHNGHDGVSNRQPHDSLLNRLLRRRSKKTSKLRVTGCVGNSPGTGEFPAQMASNAENVSIWWRHMSCGYYESD